jgi:hypothetical protein
MEVREGASIRRLLEADPPISSSAMTNRAPLSPMPAEGSIGPARALLELVLYFSGGLGFVTLVILASAPMAVIVFVAELPRMAGWLADAWANLGRLF